MKLAQACALCASFPGAVEEFPVGPQTRVYKVGGKIFALFGGASISIKGEPWLITQHRASFDAVTIAPYLHHDHWNAVVLDGDVPDAMLAEMIEDSYDLVVSRLPVAARSALSAGRPARTIS